MHKYGLRHLRSHPMSQIFHLEFKARPFWWEAYAPETVAQIDLPKEARVAIVGAGYAGLSAALALNDAGVDCVILDALMPGEVIASLALHLKKHGIPVVMISGSLDPMKDAADNGLQLLRKPFRSQELYSAVNMALASGEFGQRSQVDG